MKITILGSGTCVPTKRRAPSGYLLESGNERILLDGGSGTLRQIENAGVNYSSIQSVMYTHFHVDHTAELLPFLFARKHDPSPLLSDKFSVYGPVGILEHVLKLDQFAGRWVFTDNEKLSVNELKANEEVKIGELNISCHSTYHQQNSLGYRFETQNGKIFSYTGDTDGGERLIPLLLNADIAVVECSFPDEFKVKGHMTPSEVAKIAEDAHVKKLLITHLYPEMDKINAVSIIKDSFSGEVLLAEDLTQYEL